MPSVGEDEGEEQLVIFYIVSGNKKSYNYFGEQFGSFLNSSKFTCV